MSSGTTGQRTAYGYTKEDLVTWADIMARSLAATGCDSNSIIHIAYGYGLFTGGLGANNGSERLGAMTIPVSGGNTTQQIKILHEFGADTLCCTPSYSLKIADELERRCDPTRTRRPLDRGSFALKRGIMGAEPWSEEMRQQIEKRLGIKAYDIYGLSETMGPGVSVECEERNGMHIWEDHFLPEIINPETGKVLPNGEQGELVFTNLTKTGQPLLRYRTRDITTLDDAPCGCRRNHVKMKKLVGRSDDMLIINGANVFPSWIEGAILGSRFADHIEPHYQIVVDKEGHGDRLEVKVEVKPEMTKASAEIESEIAPVVSSIIGVRAKITLVPYGSLERSEGKAKRVIDNRNGGAAKQQGKL
jgi:phenylacetate-CoA ligase